MKNKKTLFTLFIVFALLCLGIGYAAILKPLTINGGITTGDADDLSINFIVYFSKVETDTTLANGATTTASVDAAAKSLETTFAIDKMSKVGSKIILTYTVKNDSEDLHGDGPEIKFTYNSVETAMANGDTIEIGTIYNADPYFKVTIKTLSDGVTTGQVAAKGEQKVQVIIEMTNSPVETFNANFTIKLTYNANNIRATS